MSQRDSTSYDNFVKALVLVNLPADAETACRNFFDLAEEPVRDSTLINEGMTTIADSEVKSEKLPVTHIEEPSKSGLIISKENFVNFCGERLGAS